MACRAIPKEPQRRPPRLCQVSGPRSPGSPRVSQDAGGNSIFATLRMPSVICNVALFLSQGNLPVMDWPPCLQHGSDTGSQKAGGLISSLGSTAVCFWQRPVSTPSRNESLRRFSAAKSLGQSVGYSGRLSAGDDPTDVRPPRRRYGCPLRHLNISGRMSHVFYRKRRSSHGGTEYAGHKNDMAGPALL